jgi:Protein of unknown function (DUF3300)
LHFSSSSGNEIKKSQEILRRNVMNRSNTALKLALALLALAFATTAFADQPPDNVQGNWTIYATNAGNGEIEVKHVQIGQYGNRITGYFEGPVQSGPIQGEVNGHHIRFNTVTRNVLHFRGEVFGDTMSGSCGIRGRHAPWQAVRPATAVAPVPPSTGAIYSSQPVLAPPEAQTQYQEAPAYQPSTYQSQPSYQSQPAYQPQASYQSPAQVPAPQPEAQQPTNYPAQSNATQAPAPAPLSADQLNSLVAPIALYPDALVAQVLAASTNPEQVAYADDWLAQNRNLTGEALAQAVNQQSWDPSLKALTQFPSVLDNMAHNLSWTSSLGQAFANQQSDVMAAVQTMRARAQSAGSLQSNSQITVSTSSPNTIVIQPANPQVIYVPQYNPTVVYGAPVVVPYYVPPPLPVASVGIYFGAPITIGAWLGGGGWGGGFGWGWHAWNVNWGGGWGGGGSTIIYNHTTYINNHTWNNTNYNGYHPWANNSGYHPGTDTHYGPNGGYHPNGYYGPNGHFHHDVPGTGPHDQPNGGHNGDHGLIGGNGGVQHPSGTEPHADGSSWGDRGPNGGHNGDHGMIGGNGGVQRTAADNRDRNSSRMSGDGRTNRMESNRGRGSMGGRRSQPHMARMHAPAGHRSGGGGRRR